MNTETSWIAVLVFGDAPIPRPLTGLPSVAISGPDAIDSALAQHRRLVVVGGDADLAAVLTRLLRAEAFGVEIGYVTRRRTTATRAYRLGFGCRAARRARHGTADQVPLIRDDTGTVLVGSARWLPPEGARVVHGEAVVDDTVLFDGDAAAVRVEPTATLPGLRARVTGRWVAGRAAQLGTTGATVVRDGVPGLRTVKRSTFYRHTEDWLLVR